MRGGVANAVPLPPAAESSDDMVTLYTNSGTPLPVIECEEDEMCGAAHKFHFCPNKKRERKTK